MENFQDSSHSALLDPLDRLIEEELLPYYLSGSFPTNQPFDWHLVKKLASLNVMCPVIPKEYGGLGLGIYNTSLLIERLARFCPCLSSIISANIHSVMPLLLGGSDSQKKSILPQFTGPDACLGSFALTEESGGCDMEGFTTYAKKTSDGYVLSGKKTYILNASEAKYVTLFAYTNPYKKRESLRCFLLPIATDGISVSAPQELSPLRYVRTAEIVFDQVQVDSDSAIKRNDLFIGYLLLTQVMDIGRSLTSAASVGIAKGAYKLAWEYANKKNDDRCIFDHQAVSQSFARMATSIEMAKLITRSACTQVDNDEDFSISSSMAKYASSMTAMEVTKTSSEIIGASSFVNGSLIDILYNYSRVLSTVEGTTNIQLNAIASLL